MNHIRKTNIIQITENFEQSLITQPWRPLDKYISDHFKKHNKCTPKDKAIITARVYDLQKWKLYLRHITNNRGWGSMLDALISPAFSARRNDPSLPMNVRCSFPPELFHRMNLSFGTKLAFQYCEELNKRAPLTIRANTLKTTQFDLYNQLRMKGYHVKKCEYAPNGVTFTYHPNSDIRLLKEFKKGLFEIQDEGSQLVGMRVNTKPGDLVLDACSGAGGKSLVFAPFMGNTGQIIMFEPRAWMGLKAKQRARRAGIQNAQFHSTWDHLQVFKAKMDWVITDVPCSGTGTLRRNPDQKWKFSESMLEELKAKQEEIVRKAVKYLKRGGRLVYSTCSLLHEENLNQVHKFGEELNLELDGGVHFQSFPRANGMDGFFAATMIKL